MPDVRSRYTRFTNVRRFMYCMLHFMHECSALFTSRSTYLTTTSNFFRKIVKSTSHTRSLKAHDRCHRSIGLLLLMCFCNLGHRGILLGSESRRQCTCGNGPAWKTSNVVLLWHNIVENVFCWKEKNLWCKPQIVLYLCGTALIK